MSCVRSQKQNWFFPLTTASRFESALNWMENEKLALLFNYFSWIHYICWRGTAMLQRVPIHRGVTTHSFFVCTSGFPTGKYEANTQGWSSYLLLASLALLDGSLEFLPQEAKPFWTRGKTIVLNINGWWYGLASYRAMACLLTEWQGRAFAQSTVS